MIKTVSLLVLIINVIFNGCVCGSSKLNVPRVLLPVFHDVSVNFTLTVSDGGCYQWSTTRLDIIKLDPIYDDSNLNCAHTAVVSTIPKELTRSTAIILAEDLHTGLVLRCDAIVDAIDSLNIATTTTELFVEEAPETFEVRAYDDQGNEFTTLEGVEFKWSVSFPNKTDTVLKFVSFYDSPYETPPSVAEFDRKGLQGHIVLLEGVKTGSAKVSVSLPAKEYRHVAPVEKPLTVIANLIIEPSEVYIFKGSTVKFRIFLMHHNKMERVTLPNDQYYLGISDDNVVLNSDGSVKGVSVGNVNVVLHDRNVDESDSSIRLPHATVHVVDTAYLTIDISPFRNWNVLVGQPRNIIVEAYSVNNHKIFLDDAVSIRTSISADYFLTLEHSINGSWIHGYGRIPGKTNVVAELEKAGNFYFRPTPTAQAELIIHPIIEVNPAVVFLPWDPVNKTSFEVQLTASGGDDHFHWDTSNATIAVVSQTGIVRTQSLGSVDVSASMVKNLNNFGVAKVHILPPKRLQILPGIREAETDKNIPLKIALFANAQSDDDIPFTHCHKLNFNVKIIDPNNFVHISTVHSNEKECAIINIAGHSLGQTKVIVSLTIDNVILEDSVVISTFENLNFVFPKSGELVLAVGSSSNVILSGGPKSLLHQKITSRTVLKPTPKITVMDVTENLRGKDDIYVLNVVCKQLGRETVDYIVNIPTTETNKPITNSKITLNVICGKPRTIMLKPFDISDKCPLDPKLEEIPTLSNQDVHLEVIVLDEKNRRFDNFSSLKLDWTVTPQILNLKNFLETPQIVHSVTIPHKYKQSMKPLKMGVVEVEAYAVGYHAPMLNKRGIKHEKPEFVDQFDAIQTKPIVQGFIKLNLVGTAEISPQKITVYNHRSNVQRVTITNGSGYYNIVPSRENVVHVEFSGKKQEILITPVANGELELTVYDMCLNMAPLKVTVSVVSMDIIRAEAIDRIEVTKSVPCIVKLLDYSGQSFSVPSTDAFIVKPIFQSDIIDVTLNKDVSKWEIGEIHYTIRGLKLGESKLSFVIDSNEKESTPLTIEVFPPLRVTPRNATMIISSVLQLQTIGGPSTDAQLEYTVIDSSISDVSNTGIVEGKSLGVTKITVKSVGVNSHPLTGKKIVYSEDTVQVNVIPLSGIKIHTPTIRVRKHAIVPVWVHGIPEEITPLVLGTTKLPIKFSWASSSDLLVHSNFETSNVKYTQNDMVSIRVKGVRSGTVMLSVNVTFSHKLAGPCTSKLVCDVFKTYSASVELHVFDDMRVTGPVEGGVQSDTVLMAPFSSMQLVTNKDQCCQVEFFSSNSDVATVTRNGFVHASNTTGHLIVEVKAVENVSGKKIHHKFYMTVQVKQVHYILTLPELVLSVKDNDNLKVLPVGLNLNLKVTYHDDVGTKFDAINNNIDIQSNRFDLLALDKANNITKDITMKLIKRGEAVLKIADANTFNSKIQMLDYVKLRIDNIIEPQLTRLVQGDIVAFDVPLESTEGFTGEWTVSNNDAAIVKDGILQALKPTHQPIHIYYKTNKISTAEIQLQIDPIADIVLVEPFKTITLSHKNAVQDVSFVLKSETDVKTNNLYASKPLKNDTLIHEYPFVCSLEYIADVLQSGYDVEKLFTIDSYFNGKTGRYACRISALDEPSVQTSQLHANVSVMIEAGRLVKYFRFPFVSGISIETKTLRYDANTRRAQLVIHGLPHVLKQLTIGVTNANVLDVSESYIGSTKTTKMYFVKLTSFSNWKTTVNENGKDSLYVEVLSPLTQQNYKIQIHVDMDSTFSGFVESDWGSPLLTLIWTYRTVIITTLVVIVSFLAVLYASITYAQPIINVNMREANVAPTATSTSPLTPRNLSQQYYRYQHPYSTNNSMFTPDTSVLNNSYQRLNTSQLSQTLSNTRDSSTSRYN